MCLDPKNYLQSQGLTIPLFHSYRGDVVSVERYCSSFKATRKRQPHSLELTWACHLSHKFYLWSRRTTIFCRSCDHTTIGFSGQPKIFQFICLYTEISLRVSECIMSLFEGVLFDWVRSPWTPPTLEQIPKHHDEKTLLLADSLKPVCECPNSCCTLSYIYWKVKITKNKNKNNIDTTRQLA